MRLIHKPLPPKSHFYKRLVKSALISLCLVIFSLGIGIAGYHYLGHLGFVDSLLNASMILGGMGPVDVIKEDSAKIFASIYALYSGISFLTIAAFLFAPIYHRFLHRFHLEISDGVEVDEN